MGSLLDTCPRAYGSPLPVSSLGVVALGVVDADEHDGYPASSDAERSTAAVSSLPVRGELLQLDGSPVIAGVELPTPELLVRPPHIR